MTRQQLPKPVNDDNKQRQLPDKPPGQESTPASQHEAGPSPTLRRLAVQHYARHHGNRAAIQRYGLQDRIRGSSSSPATKTPASGTGAGGAGSALSQAITGGFTLPGLTPAPPQAHQPSGSSGAQAPPTDELPSHGVPHMLAVASLDIHTAELHVRAAQSNLLSAYASLAHQDSPQAAELLQEALASLNAAQGKLTSGHQTYLVSNAEVGGADVQREMVQRSAWDWLTGSESESATEGETGAVEEGTSQHEVGDEAATGGSAGAMARVNTAIGSVISAHNWLMIYSGGAATGSHSDEQATVYYIHGSAEIGAAQGESSAALVQLLSEQAG